MQQLLVTVGVGLNVAGIEPPTMAVVVRVANVVRGIGANWSVVMSPIELIWYMTFVAVNAEPVIAKFSSPFIVV
ncbi:MAG: hypothetical protein P4L69_08095 [Desulfosporosinus sp.]|nr:hypothetical protein [Desulfosporosinus sp.]